MSGSSVGSAEDVLSFWLEELAPEDWYRADPDLDARVRDRFQGTWESAMEGGLGLWLTDPRGALAYVILTDQFPRNMFRGTARSFASDPHARAAAKLVVGRDWDLRLPEPGRQFFYLPLMHSENLVDQDRCVRLFAARLPVVGPEQMIHARAHREQIRRYGRFPMRNEALGRESTPAEATFLEAGGYKHLVEELKGAAL